MQSVVYPSIVSEIFAAGLKFFKLGRFSFKINRINENSGTLDYLQRCITKRQTLLCLGVQPDEHLFLLRKVVGSSGKLVVFAPKPIAFARLRQLVQLMGWMNVTIEPLKVSDALHEITIDTRFAKRDFTKGATVINIKEIRSYKEKKAASAQTLDAYCASENIEPDFIEINMPAYELKVLQGATEILKKHKPTVMIECEEGLAGRSNILKTFEFLTSLKYKGFFILDTIRIPLQNFDFDAYQNPRTDFYCNTFIFE